MTAMAMFFAQWGDWDGRNAELFRGGRFPLMRLVRFQISAQLDRESQEPQTSGEEQEALSVNLSSDGLCMLTTLAPAIGDVLRLSVPTPVPVAETPTLAEVRWVRPLPSILQGGFAVGVRFLL